MDQRLKFQELLVSLLGSNNVYFQPPSTIRMRYPCIIYSRESKDEKFADDMLYFGKTRYMVTIIDPNPDSLIPNLISTIPLSTFNKHFVVDNLNHDVFLIYY